MKTNLNSNFFGEPCLLPKIYWLSVLIINDIIDGYEKLDFTERMKVSDDKLNTYTDEFYEFGLERVQVKPFEDKQMILH